MRLKAMEEIDEGKDKKHAGKLTDNPKDRTPYITRQMGHALGTASGMRLCSMRDISGCQIEGSSHRKVCFLGAKIKDLSSVQCAFLYIRMFPPLSISHSKLESN